MLEIRIDSYVPVCYDSGTVFPGGPNDINVEASMDFYN